MWQRTNTALTAFARVHFGRSAEDGILDANIGKTTQFSINSLILQRKRLFLRQFFNYILCFPVGGSRESKMRLTAGGRLVVAFDFAPDELPEAVAGEPEDF